MSLSAIILIMLFTGTLGGIVNYLMPSNNNESRSGKVQTFFESLVIGIGATLLVPLFLEIAQSRLLDGITNDDRRTHPKDTLVLETMILKSSGSDSVRDSTISSRGEKKRKTQVHGGDQIILQSNDSNIYKKYLLYSAYCFLAATAGYRFISGVSDSVLKQQLKEAKKEIETKEIAKKQIEQKLELQKQQDIMQMQTDEKQILEDIAQHADKYTQVPILPPVIHRDDPQKGRFGQKSTNNFRTLKATVSSSAIPMFYEVTIWVESTDPLNHPLTDEVYFYVHDSFNPSAYSISPNEFVEGKAMDKVMSYGAFTVGAITDKGKTLLELDLADDLTFPEGFRQN